MPALDLFLKNFFNFFYKKQALDLLPVVVSVALDPVGRVAFEADDVFGALKVAVATGALAITLPA